MKRTNLLFRAMLTLVCLVASFSFASAYTTVKSIAELKQLADGTEVIFEGEAMTTLHFYRFNSPIPGIFIQDDNNDVIFLANSNFLPTATWFDDPNYNGYKMHQGGTVVTSFSGTFKKASGNNPDRVTFTEDDLEYIESGSYGNPIPYAEVTMDELIANPSQYEYQAVKVTADVTKTGTGLYATTYSFTNDAASMPIHLSAQLDGRSFPAGGTFYGMCDKYGSGHQFLILDRYHVEPTKFYNLVDLYNFVDDKNRLSVSSVELEILEPALVNFVARMPMNSNYYIQATTNGQTSALCVSATSRNNTFAAQAGDSIKGLKGYYSKLSVEDGLYKGSMFRIKEENFSKVSVINSGNPISWQEQKVYNILETPVMFESRLISLPVGEFKLVNFTENNEVVERVAFVQYDGDLRKQYDTIRVQMAGGIDMTQFVGTKAAIMGVYDLSEAIAAGYPTIILRDENDIIGNRSFASIGEMIAAGQPLSTKVTYEITNPVLVTYKYFAQNTQGDNEHMCGLYVQDATGAILYKTGQPVANVNPGDSIKGIKGAFQYERNVPGHQEHYIKGDAANTITVLNSNNTLKPTPTTLDKIVNDPMAFASHLVKIDDLEITTKFGFNQGYPYETKFIYQNGAMMNVVWDRMYENMSVTGIVEYGIMGYGLTIFPISVENTVKDFDGKCRRIKDIKNLTAGTEFTYVGNANTTFTDFENGILIQDHTGGILLKNAKLGDNGNTKIKSGMIISNIKGTYQPAKGDIMASIEIADADIEKIKIKAEDCGFTCRSTDVNVVKYFYNKYLVGEALMLRGADIRESNGKYEIVFTYYEGETEVEVKIPAVTKGSIDFSKKLVTGYARKMDGVLTFVIVDDEAPIYTEPELPEEPEDSDKPKERPTGVFMNLFAKDMAQPKGISENGKWACGSAFWSGEENQASTINASIWNLETGERIYLTDDGEISDAYCISNDGSLVCGSYLGEPAYNLNGEWIPLPAPRGYNAGGDVTTMAIVGTDTIMMGYAAKSHTEQVIVRWVNGEIDNNFKLRDYTRYAEITGDTILGETGIVRAMSNDGERYLVSLDYNLLPAAGSTNLPTTFVQFGGDDNYTSIVIEREFDIYDLVSFVEEASMSHNGKFVCGKIYAVPRTGVDAPEAPSVAFLYNVDNDQFQHYTAINNTGRYAGASCVDNQGNIYFKSINGADPLGRPYIHKDGKFIELEACLLAYDGITAEQIDAIAEEVPGSDADDLGIVWCVSGDGKTLIGAGDALKGNIWCAKLSCSPYDVEPVDLDAPNTPVKNITDDTFYATYDNGIITLNNAVNMVEIYSVTGTKVITSIVENGTIAANLNTGVYIIKAYNGNNINTGKIIIK